MPAPWGPPYPPPPTRDGLCTRGEQTKLLPLAGGGEHGATCPNFSAGGGRGGCPPPMDGWTWTDGRCRPRPLVFKRPRSYLRRLCPLCVSGSLCVCPPAPRWGVCVWGSLRPPLHPPPTLLLPGGLSRTPGSPSPTPSPGSPMWRPPPPPPLQARWFRLRLLSAPLAWFHLRASADSALSPSGHASCRRGGRSRGITVYLATPPAT